jgi:hypothetical protein
MEQAVLALPGSWAACHVVNIANGSYQEAHCATYSVLR